MSGDDAERHLGPALERIAREHGTPCYVHFLDRIEERIAELKGAFGGRFQLSYAVKSNPNGALLAWLQGRVETLDISSGGELARALAAGWDAARLSFTGPGKTPAEIEAAVRNRIGELVVESMAEAEQADRIARSLGLRQPILVRIAPNRVPKGFGLNMAGKPSQFGIDEEVLDDALGRIRGLPGLELVGFHIYSGTQCLDATAIAENWEIFLELFRRFAGTHDLTPRKLVFGAGLGIPYHDRDVPVDLRAVAGRINPQLDAFRAEPRFAGAELALELGRYLVGEAGIYLTRVIARKVSRGKVLCICDGGMNHHLAACGHFGTVIHRNYRMFRVTGAPRGAADEVVDLVGPLCTTIDTLGRGVAMPGLDVGDVVGLHCSGAYGVTASPIHFISHAPPREWLVDGPPGNERIREAG
jgi:diaminopimelate decarboxylase